MAASVSKFTHLRDRPDARSPPKLKIIIEQMVEKCYWLLPI
ncbi:hypothetical protein [Chamaesiphon minutus]|nr:hypothetical protein [Chamaesiphon minutus]